MNVIKRDGRIVPFDQGKIKTAIIKSFFAVDGRTTSYAYEKASNIAAYISKQKSDLHVEEIQDLVEKGLMSCKRKDVAKAYILYREERSRARTYNTQLMRLAQDKILARNVQNQNANLDERSFGGRMGEMSSAIMRQMALDQFMTRKSRENHLNNEVYIHDLDHWVLGDHNCLTIPFDDLLKNGFNTRQVDIRPANSVSTAMQLVAVIFQLQSLMQFGGVSASHIDWTMVPYVRKSFYKHFRDGLEYCEYVDRDAVEHHMERFDITTETPINSEKYLVNQDANKYAFDMTEKEIYQAVEAMYHNLNSLQSRSGNQLPFSSINYGTCTLPEGRLVTKAILDVSIEGLGKLHRTSIFPCGIFQCMKGINRKEGDPNYDLFRLALKSTAQRLYPNYANVDWSINEGYDKNDPKTYVSTMGCRTYNGYDINGLGHLKDGRGNICPVTIILPTVAMEAKNTSEQNNSDIIEEFFKRLELRIVDARDTLIERFEWICAQDPSSARFMYENDTMVGYIPEEGIRSALKHGTLALGQLGLAEALQILIGCDHTESEGMKLAHRIEELFNRRCKEFKEEYKLNFGVYYTPAETLCYTAMKNFKNKYGIIPNISDKEFFTNSIHVPVWKDMSPFEKIDIEAELTRYSNAGCITYVEFDSGIKNNLSALENIVNYAMDKDIPYFAVNVPNDTCLECGYTDEFNDHCPECGSEHIQQLRRVTGYLTGNYKTAFNKGKQQEVEMRVKHGRSM